MPRLVEVSNCRCSFFLLFGGAGASGSDCGGADAITLEGFAIFSAFRCFFVFGSLERGFLSGFPSGRLSDLQITLRFTTKRRAFIRKAVMLSPPIPIRATIAAGSAVMQRMMMRAVRDSGRWKTGIPIARERTMLSMALRMSKVPFRILPFSMKLGGIKETGVSSGCVMAAPPFSYLSHLPKVWRHCRILCPELPGCQKYPDTRLPASV